MSNIQFYNPNKLLSLNKLFNFVIGGRGIGKTYAFKKRSILRFLNHGEQFVFIRRFRDENDQSRLSFFKDLITDPDLQNISFDTKKNNFYVNNELAGFSFPLSTSYHLKSVAFPQVSSIIFDEFIPMNLRYLPNEPAKLLELIYTICRLRDVKTFLLANAVTVANPYFQYFNIFPSFDQEFTKFDDMVIQTCKNSDSFNNAVYNSRFGKIIKNTDYGAYSIDNNFFLDSDSFICKRPNKQLQYICSIFINNQNIAFWLDFDNQSTFADYSVDSSNFWKFCVDPQDQKESVMLLRNLNDFPCTQIISKSLARGNAFFKDQFIKSAVVMNLSNKSFIL